MGEIANESAERAKQREIERKLEKIDEIKTRSVDIRK